MIPANQLASWSRYPSPKRSVAAHAAIKTALVSSGSFNGHSVEVYLQGSYRNYVNTREDSDVDVVAELTSVQVYDVGRLSAWDQGHFWNWIPRVDYDYPQLRADVYTALTSNFGQAVVPHSKAFEVRGTASRLKVDVLPAIQYRQVYAFDGSNISSHDGIAFWTTDGRRVVNWPQHHFDNGVAKNQRSGDQYKPAVRMFKNARRVAVDRGLMPDGLAPSYFVQGLLWNVPDGLYAADKRSTYCGVLNWLVQSQGRFHTFKCQNGIDALFGSLPEQWKVGDACTVVNSLARLWNEWQ